MKITIYYFILLVFIGLLSGFLIQGSPDSMSMPQVISLSFLLGLYVVVMSFIGEGKSTDERETNHRYIANRGGLIAGTVVLSLGVIYQLFNHNLDHWLLAGLIAINLVKIIILIYANYRK